MWDSGGRTIARSIGHALAQLTKINDRMKNEVGRPATATTGQDMHIGLDVGVRKQHTLFLVGATQGLRHILNLFSCC
jgi:hypothetical protein